MICKIYKLTTLVDKRFAPQKQVFQLYRRYFESCLKVFLKQNQSDASFSRCTLYSLKKVIFVQVTMLREWRGFLKQQVWQYQEAREQRLQSLQRIKKGPHPLNLL